MEGVRTESRNIGLRAAAKAAGDGAATGRRWTSGLARCAGAANQRLIGIYVPIIILVLWELASKTGWLTPEVFPPPSAIAATGWSLTVKGELLASIGASLQRILLGLVAAILTAIPLGFLLGGWLPRLNAFMSPLMKLFSQLNAFSLFPLFVLFFGIGELSKCSLIFWASLWPILFSTIAGVVGVDPLHIKVARAMGSRRTRLFARVLFPAALPEIFTGVRIGAMVSFMMVIPSEMMGAHSGLGAMLWNAHHNYLVDRIFLAGILTALLASTFITLLLRLQRRLLRWQQGMSH